MKNPFGTWLAEQPIGNEAKSLFDEAILCYQVGAYRAALVFSWLGLMRSLARRLLTATKPADFPERSWKRLQSKLRNEKEWETAVFDSVNQTNPASIFFADEDLRAQLGYWRGRRNDCVHSRGNIIEAPHVEALWLFVRSNLSKLVVLGGHDALLERFRLHYDPSYTPPDASVSGLVAEIPEAVRPSEYREFIRKLLNTAVLSDKSYDFWYNAGRLTGLVESVQRLNDLDLTEAFAAEARTDLRTLIRIIHEVPKFVLNYADDPQFVRKLWHDILPFGRPYHGEFHFIRDSSLLVIATMIRTGLIPESERAEAWDRALEKLAGDPDVLDMGPRFLDQLEPSGFLDSVERKAFSANADIDWAHSNLGLCVGFLHRRPMTKHIASTFIELAPEVRVEALGNLWGHFNLSEEGRQKFREIIETAKSENLDYAQFESIFGPERTGGGWEDPNMS